MDFKVQILGSNSAVAAHNRFPTSQAVQVKNRMFLLDCGEGTQMRMSDFHVKRSRIDHIFISHLHGDHYFGLIGLLTSYHLTGRTNPLHLFGPPLLQDIILLQLDAGGKVDLRYELIFHVTQDKSRELLYENDDVEIHSFPLTHRIPTTGFLIREKVNPRRISRNRVQSIPLTHEDYKELQAGEDIVDKEGVRHANKELTKPAHEPRSYAFCSDTAYDEKLIRHIEAVSLLYHEATFMNNAAARARETHHSTAAQAARIAREAGVGELLLGHFSSKYRDLGPLLEEARSVFPNTRLAEEGRIYEPQRRDINVF